MKQQYSHECVPIEYWRSLGWWMAILQQTRNPNPKPETDNPDTVVATINLRLPRRSLLVQFTCNGCGERTERLVNRLAYERGVIFVQCAGCLQHHKLVDNLGLVTEYNFREETNREFETDQV
ncbi:DNL-type zinc finger protein [Quillaja saponaria]|uniref:DNL-type zinc finger protein n=1 Tax=Quillaja saponaria TaxID=32244 RepID=A0AAD7KNR0_QUISA|nr:DNL-type zinc finger protein [Quillaja saponaria]